MDHLATQRAGPREVEWSVGVDWSCSVIDEVPAVTMQPFQQPIDVWFYQG